MPLQIDSHRQGLWEHGKSVKKGNVLQDNQAIELESKDGKRVIQTKLSAGQATFHHGLLVHSSPPNKSYNPGRRRCSLTVQYVTPKATFQPMDYNNPYEEDWRKPILVSGEDRIGHIKYTTSIMQLYATLNN